jgi:hypothetical protein
MSGLLWVAWRGQRCPPRSVTPTSPPPYTSVIETAIVWSG